MAIFPFEDHLLRAYLKARYLRVGLYRDQAEDKQQALFKSLLADGKHTWIGQRYGLDPGMGYQAFARQVPIHRYEDLAPAIERTMRGEPNVLWPTPVVWFSKSSGTTNNKSKYIPVTRESLYDGHFRAGKDMLAIYHNLKPEAQIHAGKTLRLGGSLQANPYLADSWIGDVSAVIMRSLPWWVNQRNTPSLDVALMPEWESKIDAIVAQSMYEDVRALAGVPSWMLILLKTILDRSGASSLQEVWPNLEVYFHGGVSFAPYEVQYRELLQHPNMTYLQTYNASEGFFGIQDTPDNNQMLLQTDHGTFFEFIPADQMNHLERAQPVPLEGVAVGETYAMVITTNGGLWRYLIGDTIRFTSTRPYRFAITGRTKHFINAFGEELVVENAELAIARACEATEAVVVEYSAAPVYMDTHHAGAHEWVIEFKREPASMDHFREVLDAELKRLNSDYEAKRHKDMALQPPRIRVARPGLFLNWLSAKGKLGGQHKVPRLSNTREYVDELLQLNGS